MISGSCRLGLWRVAVNYTGNTIYRVRFVKSAPDGQVPVQFTRYLAGKSADFSPLVSAASDDDAAPYAAIYRAVSHIPYGETKTYGEIAKECGTHARVVGNAMARNPTPLIIPCHRVTAADGLGGFSPDIEIKQMLLAMEKKNKGKV
ncbi:MAG TPA: methylated-DNA--[protein]-cysteine S-methyltransferase [Methanocorpusculum sp.]|nr:methylated-DNA--[protein]-cysteine S-methyltransferase [Methanocorpusculum sp.]